MSPAAFAAFSLRFYTQDKVSIAEHRVAGNLRIGSSLVFLRVHRLGATVPGVLSGSIRGPWPD